MQHNYAPEVQGEPQPLSKSPDGMTHEELWAWVQETYEPEPLVYFVGASNGMVKIGFAKDFDARLSQLVCMSPVPLEVLAWTPGARKEEGDYHDRFKSARHHGEWFHRTPEIDAEIDRLVAILNAPRPPKEWE